MNNANVDQIEQDYGIPLHVHVTDSNPVHVILKKCGYSKSSFSDSSDGFPQVRNNNNKKKNKKSDKKGSTGLKKINSKQVMGSKKKISTGSAHISKENVASMGKEEKIKGADEKSKADKETRRTGSVAAELTKTVENLNYELENLKLCNQIKEDEIRRLKYYVQASAGDKGCGLDICNIGRNHKPDLVLNQMTKMISEMDETGADIIKLLGIMTDPELTKNKEPKDLQVERSDLNKKVLHLLKKHETLNIFLTQFHSQIDEFITLKETLKETEQNLKKTDCQFKELQTMFNSLNTAIEALDREIVKLNNEDNELRKKCQDMSAENEKLKTENKETKCEFSNITCQERVLTMEKKEMTQKIEEQRIELEKKNCMVDNLQNFKIQCLEEINNLKEQISDLEHALTMTDNNCQEKIEKLWIVINNLSHHGENKKCAK